MVSVRVLSRVCHNHFLLSSRGILEDALEKAAPCARKGYLVLTRSYSDKMGRPKVYFDMAAGDSKLGRIEFEVLCRKKNSSVLGVFWGGVDAYILFTSTL